MPSCRAPPLRAGALASAPLVVAGLATAARDSLARVVVVVVASPFALLASGLVATAGILVGDYLREEAAARRAPRPAPGVDRPGRFETKVQRGRFLVGLFLVVGVGGWLVVGRPSGAADAKARAREAVMRHALSGLSPRDYGLGGLAAGTLPGGPYRSVQVLADGLHVADQVDAGLQSRCVRADVRLDGTVTTRVSRTAC